MSEPVDDEALLAGVRSGRPDWQAIYLAYRRLMLGVAAKVLGRDQPCPAEGGLSRLHGGVSASDVVSEVVASLQEDGIPPAVRNLRAYLATATANKAIDVIRRNTVERQVEGKVVHQPRYESLPDGEAGVMPERELDTEAVVAEIAMREAVLANLSLLTPNERFVLGERVFKRRPAREVAEELGVSPQRISQLARAASKRILQAIGRCSDH
ncbi:MAG: RNA polymerase sigma factor [Chloroflexota bacterium]